MTSLICVICYVTFIVDNLSDGVFELFKIRRFPFSGPGGDLLFSFLIGWFRRPVESSAGLDLCVIMELKDFMDHISSCRLRWLKIIKMEIA